MKQYMSEYEKFVFLNSSGSFTQSENWCKIKNEWKSERIIIRDESGNIIGTMQILIKNIPLMNTVFMYAPRGPVCDCHNLDILSKIIEQAKLLAEPGANICMKYVSSPSSSLYTRRNTP